MDVLHEALAHTLHDEQQEIERLRKELWRTRALFCIAAGGEVRIPDATLALLDERGTVQDFHDVADRCLVVKYVPPVKAAGGGR